MRNSETKDISVLNPNGSKQIAKITWWSAERDTCWVEIEFSAGVYAAEGRDFFEALQRSRLELEASGHRLLCWGASRNVWPSGMGRDMGRGLKAYENKLGLRCPTLRAIFDSDPSVVVSSVSEQIAWNEEWHRSIPWPRYIVIRMRCAFRSIERRFWATIKCARRG